MDLPLLLGHSGDLLPVKRTCWWCVRCCWHPQFPACSFSCYLQFHFCDYQNISNAVPLLDMISGFSTMLGCLFESHCHTPLKSNIKALYSVANGKFSFQCHRCPCPTLFEGKVIHVSGACSALAGWHSQSVMPDWKHDRWNLPTPQYLRVQNPWSALSRFRKSINPMTNNTITTIC